MLSRSAISVSQGHFRYTLFFLWLKYDNIPNLPTSENSIRGTEVSAGITRTCINVCRSYRLEIPAGITSPENYFSTVHHSWKTRIYRNQSFPTSHPLHGRCTPLTTTTTNSRTVKTFGLRTADMKCLNISTPNLLCDGPFLSSLQIDTYMGCFFRWYGINIESVGDEYRR